MDASKNKCCSVNAQCGRRGSYVTVIIKSLLIDNCEISGILTAIENHGIDRGRYYLCNDSEYTIIVDISSSSSAISSCNAASKVAVLIRKSRDVLSLKCSMRFVTYKQLDMKLK